MKRTCTFSTLLIMFVFCTGLTSYSQQPASPDTPAQVPDTSKVPAAPVPSMPPAAMPPGTILYNAGFDVIITYDGNIIYGLVKEVGEFLIKYQRTDIPDGPIYTIPRNLVYAISYRNQVKELINPGPANPDQRGRNGISRNNNPYNRSYRRLTLSDANVRIGLGFIRGYTKVDNADDLSSSATFPVVNIAYDMRYQNLVRLGLQLSFGSHKFSRQEFSSYDSTQTNSSIKENIFSIALYGKYTVTTSVARLRPYVLVGLAINTSHTHTEDEIKFYNNSDQSLLVSSGGRSVGLGLLARAGTDYFFNSKIGAFADVGSGTSLLQVGAVINIQ